MTREEAEEMVRRAKPCAFCGERLVDKNDHHGYWLGHKNEFSECAESIVQILDEDDLKRWNTRAPIEVTGEMVRKAVRDYHDHLYDHRNDLDGAMRAALEAALNGGGE